MSTSTYSTLLASANDWAQDAYFPIDEKVPQKEPFSTIAARVRARQVIRLIGFLSHLCRRSEVGLHRGLLAKQLGIDRAQVMSILKHARRKGWIRPTRVRGVGPRGGGPRCQHYAVSPELRGAAARAIAEAIERERRGGCK